MPRRTDYRRRLFVGLVALFVASLIVFLVAVLLSPGKDTLAFEGAKMIPQVGLVAVAGAIISYLAFEYQQAHLRSEARLNLLRGVLSTATQAYLDVKRARRSMRATGVVIVDGSRHVDVAQYDERMSEIIDAELKIEQLIEEVSSSGESFSDVDVCVHHLRDMERTLHAVIAEYETLRPGMVTATSHPLERLPSFRRLLARPGEEPGEYHTGFRPVTVAMTSLRQCVRADLRESTGRTPTGGPVRPLEPDAGGRHPRPLPPTASPGPR